MTPTSPSILPRLIRLSQDAIKTTNFRPTRTFTTSQYYQSRKMTSPIANPAVEAGKSTPPTESTPRRQPTPPPSSLAYKPRYIDIALNLADPVYRGIYHSQQRHDDDLGGVLQRAGAAGCSKILVTGSDLHNSKTCVELCQEIANNSKAWGGVKAWSTVGIHPCHAKEVMEDGFWETFKTRVEEGVKGGWVKAFGEFGLDCKLFRIDESP